jgi:hypothetical protein
VIRGVNRKRDSLRLALSRVGEERKENRPAWGEAGRRAATYATLKSSATVKRVQKPCEQ